MTHYRIKLFVAGNTPRIEQMVANLHKVAQEFKHTFEIIVVDIIENPDLALKDNIFATPTLIKESPPPIKQVFGDFQRREKILQGLDLTS